MDQKIKKNLLELVKDSYGKIAEDFSTTRQKELWPEIKEFTATIEDHSKILDAGCGNGRLVRALLNKKITYLGIDNSPELVKVAKNNYPGYQFLVNDILELDSITQNNFDYIFFIAVLQHIPSQELRITALEQLRNKLGVNGQIIISNWNLWQSPKHRFLLFKNYWFKILGNNKLDFRDIIFPWKNSQGQIIGQRYYHAFTREELETLFKLVGLQIVKKIINKYNYWYILK